MPGFGGLALSSGPDHRIETHRDHRWVIEDLGFPINAAQGALNQAVAQGQSGTSIASRAGALQSAATSRTLRYRLYAKSIQLPELEFDTKEAPGASLDYPFASKAKFDPVTIKMYDIYGLHKIFKDWQDLIWTPEDGIKPVGDYVGKVRFSLTDGQGETLRTYELLNAFPKKVGHSELSYTSSEIKLLSITYAFSHITSTFND